jgi:hypothetical protein
MYDDPDMRFSEDYAERLFNSSVGAAPIQLWVDLAMLSRRLMIGLEFGEEHFCEPLRSIPLDQANPHYSNLGDVLETCFINAKELAWISLQTFFYITSTLDARIDSLEEVTSDLDKDIKDIFVKNHRKEAYQKLITRCLTLANPLEDGLYLLAESEALRDSAPPELVMPLEYDLALAFPRVINIKTILYSFEDKISRMDYVFF